MNVRMTDVLRQELLEIGDDPDDLIKEFSDWKSRGPQGENDHYYFGKDGEYIRPTVDNERVLRHVHFVPFTDVIALEAWDLAWSRRGRRVSDTALVLAHSCRTHRAPSLPRESSLSQTHRLPRQN